MHKTIKIKGMSCEHCAHIVEKALHEVPGVKEVKVDLKDNKATIDGEATNHELKAAVSGAGYEATEIY